MGLGNIDRLSVMWMGLVSAGLLLGCGGAKKDTPTAQPIQQIAGQSEGTLSPIPDEEAKQLRDRSLFLAATANIENTVVQLISRYADGAQASMVELLLKQGLVSQLGNELADAVDLRGPMALGFWNEEQNPWAVAVRLMPGKESTLKKAFRQKPLTQEVTELQPARGMNTGQVGTRFQCVLFSERETHLVCATKALHLPVIAKVLANRAQTTNKSLLIEVDIGEETTRELVKEQLGQGEDEPHENIVNEWLESVAKVDLDLSLTSEGLAVGVDLVHDSPSRPMVRAFLAPQTGPKLPPAFSALPSNTKFALASGGFDTQLSDAVMGWFEKETKNSPSDDPRNDQQMLALIKELMGQNRSMMVASGIDFAKAKKKLDKILRKKKPKLSKAQSALGAWYGIGLEADFAICVQGLREMVRIINDETATAKKKGKRQRDDEIDGKMESFTTLKLKKTNRRTDLPNGSMYLKIITTPNPKHEANKAKARSGSGIAHLYVTTDGSRTWIVFSQHKADALDAAKILIGRGNEDTDPRMLSPFRPEGVKAASITGFISPAGLNHFASDSETIEEVRATRDELAKLLESNSRDFDGVPLVLHSSEGEDGSVAFRFRATISDNTIRSLLGTDSFSKIIQSAAIQ